MNMQTIICDAATNWRRSPPAPSDVLQSLIDGAGIRLPSDYIDLLSLSNGGEGDLPVQPYWFALWSAEEVLQANAQLEIPVYLPGFFGIGSSGGGEVLAFDTQVPTTWPVVAVPAIGMAAELALPIALDFLAFARMLGRST